MGVSNASVTLRLRDAARTWTGDQASAAPVNLGG